VRFRFRLVGLEEGWTETEANEARFPALPAGAYRLEVVAVSGLATGRLRSPRPATFSFTVPPAWWERWWARAAGLLLLALGIALAVRLRTRALEADRRRLEQAVSERSAALAAAVGELREASLTDPLTGVRNRRYLTAQPLPASPDLVVYLVDVDHFKAVNDRYGHRVGDLLLVAVAARLGAVVRDGDLLVRWGGEEFLIVARDTVRGEAWRLAERILESLGGRPYDLEGQTLRCTASVGWAPFPWFPEAPRALAFEQVLTLADHALYLAKRTGRNRAVGVLPAGTAAAVEEGHPGWLQPPLAPDLGEGRWSVLVRTPGPAVDPAA
jgi:diguanylate cyclase (GGDEF)-like protein